MLIGACIIHQIVYCQADITMLYDCLTFANTSSSRNTRTGAILETTHSRYHFEHSFIGRLIWVRWKLERKALYSDSCYGLFPRETTSIVDVVIVVVDAVDVVVGDVGRPSLVLQNLWKRPAVDRKIGPGSTAYEAEMLLENKATTVFFFIFVFFYFLLRS